jgi:predicted TIM-barrel fold metal-dependent hydrolase
MAAAWHGYLAWGHAVAPDLVVCFTMLAGLAPLHEERFRARAGAPPAIPHRVFLETSSYGPRAVDAMIRSLGVDRLLYGSDRPYAEPTGLGLGPAVEAALRSANPPRLFPLEVLA